MLSIQVQVIEGEKTANPGMTKSESTQTNFQKALENSKGRKLSKIRCKMKNLAKSGTALKISLMCSA